VSASQRKWCRFLTPGVGCGPVAQTKTDTAASTTDAQIQQSHSNTDLTADKCGESKRGGRGKMNAQPKQRSDAWFASRKGKITASKVGAILGLSKYRSRDDVLRQMVREHFDAVPEFISNEATRYGELHEADALDAYEQRYGTIIEPSGLVVHALYDWLAASPDGLVGEHGLVECKCPYRSKYTTPSDEYVAQMQLQMACTGRDWCDFVIWREGDPII